MGPSDRLALGAIVLALSFASGCSWTVDSPPSPTGVGCIAPSLTKPAGVVVLQSYDCSASSNATMSRLRACVSLPDDPRAHDDEMAYCAVVDLAPELLAADAGKREFVLDGTASVAFSSNGPLDVTYQATSPTAEIARAWIAKACFCSLVGDQTVTGILRIDSATAGHVAGHVTMRASIVSPDSSAAEDVTVDSGFDVDIAALPPQLALDGGVLPFW